MENLCGVIVGCDVKQQWLLPWWWKAYRRYNDFPIFFADFGLSTDGRAWCEEKGTLISLPSLLSHSQCSDLDEKTRIAWEERYGPAVWKVRSAWLQKPLALLHYPLHFGVWLDLDCQVRANLAPLFNLLQDGCEIGIAKDRDQGSDFMFQGEVCYNSGVIAFRNGPFLQKWADAAIQWERKLPGDQEILSRALFLHEPKLKEIPPEWNWVFPWGLKESALIWHFCGGLGKLAILENLSPGDCAPFAKPQPTGQKGEFILPVRAEPVQ